MKTLLGEVKKQAMKLPPSERALLAQHLIKSLEEFDEIENERLWVEEAELRYQEYKKGRIPSRSSKEVFKDAFKRFQ